MTKKIAIVGFTESKRFVPWDDLEWEVWGCNNLHLTGLPRYNRWYDLHDLATIRSDTEHVAWLTTTKVPVYMWEPQSEWPTSIALPKSTLVERFGSYFTNSISWMIAHAILEGATTIGVYGVDMAQGTEYAAQRPSCEYFLGLARGMGIEIIIPETSDLLKSAAMYGAESDSALRLKLESREAELQEKMREATAARDQAQAAIFQLQGALETTQYIKTVWTQPAAGRDGQVSQYVMENTEPLEVEVPVDA